ncbi:hypothetical protein PIB30_016734 [Stylosanthes scabra]|uniref:RING-type E3 ubiquitin transferase n=1 Tax=Stylosanthes scabra TaxID=79078 RepID=A0ABU6Z428_9FABA|nr:hypothetical protein [Stylosanthes scabra]
MPFNPSKRLRHSLLDTKLVSFKVVDVSSDQYFENTVSLGGITSIGILGDGSDFTHPYPCSFTKRPGLSLLKIAFEGVYLQSNENGKEHLMCLLGNTTLPVPAPEPFNCNGHLLDYTLLQDDQILLVLRYPQTFNLTSRVVRGEMQSLKQEGSLGYFDNVNISSQLNHHSSYQFSSELKSRSCDLYPYQQELTTYGAKLFDSACGFCCFLRQVTQQPFDILQNYNERHVASKLGPFQLGKEFSSNWTHENIRLLFQNHMCEEEASTNNVQSARVSAVLRAFPASLPIYSWQERTGLPDLTLFAEGTWNSLTRKLCMTGCVNSVLEECNYQISLHFPNVFSIKQRSVVLGSIYSITNETNTPFLPLLFDFLRSPSDLKSLGLYDNPHYNYSKVELAAANKKKNQPSKLFTFIKKLFLKYPTLMDGLDLHAQLNFLSNKLNVQEISFRHQSSSNQNSRVYMQMQVLSLDTSYQHETTEPEEKNLINISLHMSLSERYWGELEGDEVVSPYFLEGVYDPLAGDMHLIGCRKVSSNNNSSVEHGLDCLVEVKVQYSSESTRWLKNPSLEMTITSQRSEEDELHFKPITLKTPIISYNEHERDYYASRKIFEGILRLLISLSAVGIIWSQLQYMNRNEGYIPYMSLGTLSLLMFGYGADLIRTSEILIGSEVHGYEQALLEALQTSTRFLVLVSLLLTVKQYQKVSEVKKKPKAYYLVPAMLMINLKMQDFFLIPQVIENKVWSSQGRPLRKTYYFGLTLLRLVTYFYDYIRDPLMYSGDIVINNQVGSEFSSIYDIMKKHCSSYLSLASKLSPDANRGIRIKTEFSFSNGDWEQEGDHATLMSFEGHGFPSKLVSFKVMDISSVHQFENTVSLGGIMSIGISDGSYGAFPTSSYLPFIIRPGLSFLKISFEGVYLESNDHENGKEHLLCLLGNTTLPISKPFIDDWNDHYLEYSLLQDDQILLVLRYPQSFNLTSRAVNQEGSLAYFDNVHISSQLNVYSMYQFSSELKSRSCDLHPYEQDLTAYGSKSFKSSFDFCHSLRGVSRRPFDILQDHKDRHDASKLGPFQLGKESNSAWTNGNYRLVFHNLICDEEINSNNLHSARVSAVLRAFPASMDALTERARTGLSGMTLSVEGRWESSTKKLCMIGCVGVVDSESEVCNSLISLHFPNLFSIEQRSLMKGSISSISNETNMFFLPLFFDSQWSPMDLKSLMSLKDIPYYNYSKVELASAIRKKNQPSKSLSLSKKPFFKLNGYPNKLDILKQ